MSKESFGTLCCPFSVLFQLFSNEHIIYCCFFFLFLFFKEFLLNNPLNLRPGMGWRKNSFLFMVVSPVWRQKKKKASLYSEHSFGSLAPSVKKDERHIHSKAPPSPSRAKSFLVAASGLLRSTSALDRVLTTNMSLNPFLLSSTDSSTPLTG